MNWRTKPTSEKPSSVRKSRLSPNLLASRSIRFTRLLNASGNRPESCVPCRPSWGKNRYPTSIRATRAPTTISGAEMALGTFHRSRASTGAESATPSSTPSESNSTTEATPARKRQSKNKAKSSSTDSNAACRNPRFVSILPFTSRVFRYTSPSNPL